MERAIVTALRSCLLSMKHLLSISQLTIRTNLLLKRTLVLHFLYCQMLLSYSVLYIYRNKDRIPQAMYNKNVLPTKLRIIYPDIPPKERHESTTLTDREALMRNRRIPLSSNDINQASSSTLSSLLKLLVHGPCVYAWFEVMAYPFVQSEQPEQGLPVMPLPLHVSQSPDLHHCQSQATHTT